MKKLLNNNLGFTLVELLVVMAIMGILAVITLANFSTSQAKGRDAQRKSDLKQVSIALEAYYADHGAYPVGTAGKIMACDDSGGDCTTASYPTACNWTGTASRQFCDQSNTVYMKELPNDPTSSRQYYYVSEDGKSYGLYAGFENLNDIDCLSKTGSVCNTIASSGDLDFVYGISSSNTTPMDLVDLFSTGTEPDCLEPGAVCSSDPDCCNNVCKDRGGGLWLCDE